MTLQLTSKTGITFDIIKATDRYFLMTTSRSERVFTLYHRCTVSLAEDKFPCYEDGSHVRSFGLIGGTQIRRAWDTVMSKMTCFNVRILEYVGDMEFSSTRICFAPSLKALWDKLGEEMVDYRGRGEYLSDSDRWDYGETIAKIDDVSPVDRDVAKLAIQHQITSLWLWV